MTEYRKAVDEAHKIKLPSKIVQALWTCRVICVGEKAPFEVWTHFVGNGADIQVEVIDRKGKKIGKIQGKVFGNYFSDAIQIPDKAQEALMFTVKLPKHNLEKKSDICRILAPIKISNQKWSPKQPRNGEMVKLSADVENLPDGSEVMIIIKEYDRAGAHDFITSFSCRVENGKIEVEWIYKRNKGPREIQTFQQIQQHGKNDKQPEYFWVAEYGGKRFGDKQESGFLESAQPQDLCVEFILKEKDTLNSLFLEQAYLLEGPAQIHGSRAAMGFVHTDAGAGSYDLTLEAVGIEDDMLK